MGRALLSPFKPLDIDSIIKKSVEKCKQKKIDDYNILQIDKWLNGKINGNELKNRIREA